MSSEERSGPTTRRMRSSTTTRSGAPEAEPDSDSKTVPMPRYSTTTSRNPLTSTPARLGRMDIPLSPIIGQPQHTDATKTAMTRNSRPENREDVQTPADRFAFVSPSRSRMAAASPSRKATTLIDGAASRARDASASPARLRRPTPPTPSGPTDMVKKVAQGWLNLMEKYVEQLQEVQEKTAAFTSKQTPSGKSYEDQKKILHQYVCEPGAIQAHSTLMKCYSVWYDQLRVVVLDASFPERKKTFVSPLKRLVASLFLNGHLYKGLLCIRDLFLLGHRDIDVEADYMRWIIILAEWEILDEFLKAPYCSRDRYIEHDALIDTCTIIKNYFAEPRKRESAINSLNRSCEEFKDTKTFVAYEHLYLAHLTLSTAYKCPGMDSKKIQVQDGLFHLEKAFHASEVIVKNRCNKLLCEEHVIPFQPKELTAHNTMRMAISIAEYFYTMQHYCMETYMAGQMREACGQSARFLTAALKIGCPQWVARAVTNMWWTCTSSTDVTCANNKVLKEMVHLVFQTDPSPPVESNEGAGDESTVEDGCGINKTIGVLADELADSVRELCVTKEDDTFPPLHLFSELCDCRNCGIGRADPGFVIEWHLMALAYDDFPADFNHERMEKLWTDCRTKVAVDQCAILGKTLKPRPPSAMCAMWCVVMLQWLRTNDGVSRPKASREMVKKIIDTAHKIATYSYVQLYAFKLSIKQASRGGVEVPGFSWMYKDDFIERILSRVPGKKTKSTSPTTMKEEPSKELLNSMRKEYGMFSHLMYRDWRFPICSMIAQKTTDPWEAAMMMTELGLLATRQAARMQCGKKITGFDFNDPKHFKASVTTIPEDMSVVQLTQDDAGTLFLVKMHRDREPIIVPLATREKVSTLLSRMKVILRDNDETGSLGKVTQDPKVFWKERRRVEADLKTFCETLDKDLGSFTHLLKPSGTLGKEGLKAAKLMQQITGGPGQSSPSLPMHICKELVYLFPSTPYEQWKDLVKKMCELCGVNKAYGAHLSRSNDTFHVQMKAAEGDVVVMDHRYTLLVLSPDLSCIPWESFSPFTTKGTYVGRIPSIHQLFVMLSKDMSVPLSINPSKGYYVMDPDNNLSETSKRMGPYLDKFGWKGTAGKAPDAEVFKTQLKNNEVYVYVGHGSGSRYVGRTAVRESGCTAVGFLMGCSSVAITPEGRGQDGRSCVYDYAIAQCPCVVGCLWMVTDGEIDRYFVKLADYLFTESEKHPDANEGLRFRMLMDAMGHAREHAKLPYLTGAAVVSYGIPFGTSPGNPFEVCQDVQ